MIVRTYKCNDCDEVFEITCSMSDGDPDCPNCKDVVLEWQPKSFSIGGSVTSKAVDLTQDILEKDYGHTNWNDSMREGDIAHKSEARPRAEQEVMAKLEHDAKEYAKQAESPKSNPGFWGHGAGGPPANMIAAAMQGARQQTALANSEGRNPMDLFSKAGKDGSLNIPFKPIARG